MILIPDGDVEPHEFESFKIEHTITQRIPKWKYMFFT